MKKDVVKEMVEIVARYNGILAGAAGFELWGKPEMVIRCENICATMYCRAAGKVLKRAQALGLVYSRQDRNMRLWYAIKK